MCDLHEGIKTYGNEETGGSRDSLAMLKNIKTVGRDGMTNEKVKTSVSASGGMAC